MPIDALKDLEGKTFWIANNPIPANQDALLLKAEIRHIIKCLETRGAKVLHINLEQNVSLTSHISDNLRNKKPDAIYIAGFNPDIESNPVPYEKAARACGTIPVFIEDKYNRLWRCGNEPDNVTRITYSLVEKHAKKDGMHPEEPGYKEALIMDYLATAAMRSERSSQAESQNWHEKANLAARADRRGRDYPFDTRGEGFER